MTTDWDPWSYREKSGMTAQGGVNLVGHNVEATDGGIGKVDEATNEVGSSYIVVDTGPYLRQEGATRRHRRSRRRRPGEGLR